MDGASLVGDSLPLPREAGTARLVVTNGQYRNAVASGLLMQLKWSYNYQLPDATAFRY